MMELERQNKFEIICKNLLCGGVAGMLSKTTVAPLDRVKILLQAHNRHHESHGVVGGLRHVINKEGPLALYKGNGAQMVRIFPYAAIQFTSFEVYKKYLDGVFGETSHIDKFLAGAAAGLTSVFCTYPLDTIRARLAFQVSGEHIYTGIAHAASTIFKEEGGARALYRGFTPTLMGMVPYAGLSFYIFEYIKYGFMKYLPHLACNPCEKNTGGLVLTVPAKLLSGGLAGAVAQSVSYPLDVTRRRMQLAMMNPETHHYGHSMFTTLYKIYTEHGVIKGLYRGMSINYMRAIPMVAVSFSTYELCKQLLNLDTGLKVSVG
ncbi:solute carrier family 25 member 16-like [Diabrotica virgifera virgifera]|uniref:Graves disease carrier protein homolog n=2 Tax=Diabrotica virgifera virgifera TaxID=50390 RepID=A0ABM5KWC7_DIAVI|nr:solute carrier family 25 member 16-like [Diabrotica virgifera virgifera]XP_050514491.1 solute carrier family 25 member 16-like [Diabrotica virgifera virgifera]